MSEPARHVPPSESGPRSASGSLRDWLAAMRTQTQGPIQDAMPSLDVQPELLRPARPEPGWSPRLVEPAPPPPAPEDTDVSDLMAENLMLKAKLDLEAGRQDALEAKLAEEIRALRGHVQEEVALLESFRAESDRMTAECENLRAGQARHEAESDVLRRERDRIASLDATVDDGDALSFAGRTAQVMHMPGHTQGHVVFHFADEGLLFCGDNLFAMGCGRLFEGTPDEMFANMRRFAALPDATLAYGAHEYTLGNGRYALVAEPDNAAVRERMIEVERLRGGGEPTLPTTIGLEKATNPFMRAGSVEEFAERRRAKDNFRG